MAIEGVRRGCRPAGARQAGALAIVAAAALGCAQDPAQSFESDYTRAVCKRIFECCSPSDLMVQTKGTDEASCAAINGAQSARITAEFLASGMIRFDAAAGQRCLAALQRQACPAVFDPKFGRVTLCADVFPGGLPLGAPCDDDFVCQSNDCEGQMCIVRAPRLCDTLSCAADEFCDPASGCQPRPGADQPCPAFVCTDGLTCLDGKCALPLADGARCATVDDCAGTCSMTAPTAGMCRPPFCQGP